MGYVIDVYRGDIRPTRDPIAFLAFVSFFPQLVAGPIERASNLLPQFTAPRRFDHPLAVEGVRQMLWGFFKKVLVADTSALIANRLLGLTNPSTASVWAGIFAFAIQIYGDFSGYSDIAIGCAKLFGIRLKCNFRVPYFSRSIAEFWRRWHISLNTWFRDYLYIPLGGSRTTTAKKVRNTFAIFLVSGLWHGANWTFVFWGAFHALCFLPLLLSHTNRRHASDVVAKGHCLPSLRELAQMATTFLLVLIGWTFFRAPDLATAFDWLGRMFGLVDCPLAADRLNLSKLTWPLLTLLAVEWLSRDREVPLLPRWKWLRWLIYWGLILWMVYRMPGSETFVYFQF